MYNVLIVGPAGSGKSTLTASFGRWLESSGHRVGYFNLDPGADFLPYAPTFDIRSVLTLEKIMLAERLAPNGALIRAAEVMESSMHAIVENFTAAGKATDFCLIDTPGQMEVFLFRDLGPSLVSMLQGRVLALTIIEPGLLRSGADLVTLRLLGLLTELRLGVPSIEVLNKSDLFSGAAMAELDDEVSRSHFNICGLSAELAEQLQRIVKSLGKYRRMISVSSKTGDGMDDLYKELGESFCGCGDLS